MPAENYYNLGSYHRKISTFEEEAQVWFDRGLIWSYGFNHQESVKCFEKAIAIDPSCAMAHWGLAYALGPNYNKPWEVFDAEDLQTTRQRAFMAARAAQEMINDTISVEKSLITAIQFRYPQDSPIENYTKWNQDYADAMELVYKSFPDDLDVAALYADALMNLTPWSLWNIKTGQPAPGARTLDAKAVFDRSFSTTAGMHHPGLLHLYVHLMEMSTTPEKALPLANNLRNLVPDAGHLNHMPTHLDVLCGDYLQAIESNSQAIAADEKYLTNAGSLNFYTLYRSHNYHFRIYAAMFAGKSNTALETVARLESSITEECLRVQTPPMADWLEGFLAMRIHVLVRFGMWSDIINLSLPKDSNLYCVTTTMLHYAKGLAHAAVGQIRDADREQTNFLSAYKRVPKSRTLFNNTCVDILKIAEHMLDGEIKYRKGQYDIAFQKLRQAIELDDSLPYDEPWGWMQPVRHAYGALLLEQGKVDQAAAVYKADLGLDDTLPRALQHPNNIWALHGYQECLIRLGQDSEALAIKQKLQLAQATADVLITSSCYCRVGSV